jgi:hypothetical protein
VSHQAGCSKFFTFIVLLQLSGMIVAGLGHFPYAHSNTGGIVIGNILAGVIVRNELFGRLLYLIVNTFFAKVGQIPFSYRVPLIQEYSGLPCGSDWLAHRCYSILVESTPAARFQLWVG